MYREDPLINASNLKVRTQVDQQGAVLYTSEMLQKQSDQKESQPQPDDDYDPSETEKAGLNIQEPFREDVQNVEFETQSTTSVEFVNVVGETEYMANVEYSNQSNVASVEAQGVQVDVPQNWWQGATDDTQSSTGDKSHRVVQQRAVLFTAEDLAAESFEEYSQKHQQHHQTTSPESDQQQHLAQPDDPEPTSATQQTNVPLQTASSPPVEESISTQTYVQNVELTYDSADQQQQPDTTANLDEQGQPPDHLQPDTVTQASDSLSTANDIVVTKLDNATQPTTPQSSIPEAPSKCSETSETASTVPESSSTGASEAGLSAAETFSMQDGGVEDSRDPRELKGAKSSSRDGDGDVAQLAQLGELMAEDVEPDWGASFEENFMREEENDGGTVPIERYRPPPIVHDFSTERGPYQQVSKEKPPLKKIGKGTIQVIDKGGSMGTTAEGRIISKNYSGTIKVKTSLTRKVKRKDILQQETMFASLGQQISDLDEQAREIATSGLKKVLGKIGGKTADKDTSP